MFFTNLQFKISILSIGLTWGIISLVSRVTDTAQAIEHSFQHFQQFCSLVPSEINCTKPDPPIALANRSGTLATCSIIGFDRQDDYPCKIQMTDVHLTLYLEVGEEQARLDDEKSTAILILSPTDITGFNHFEALKIRPFMAGQFGFSGSLVRSQHLQFNFALNPSIEQAVNFDSKSSNEINTHPLISIQVDSEPGLNLRQRLIQLYDSANLNALPAPVTTPIVASNLQQLLDTNDCDRCELRGVNLAGANLEKADLRGANLVGANLAGVNFRKAQLKGANLKGANLQGANLQNAVLSPDRGHPTNLQQANLRAANLSEANLRGADLRWANLSRADLTEANVQSGEFSDDRTFAYYFYSNLSYANLQDANLQDAKFNHAFLYQTQLKGAKLNKAEFKFAYLRQANLSDTDFNVEQFKQANLCRAILPNGTEGQQGCNAHE